MAATDLLTTSEAKGYLGIGVGDASSDALVATYVTACSDRIADAAGTVIYGTVTAEAHDGGAGHIYLDHSPVAQVVSVVEYDETTAATLTAETNSSKPAAGYVIDTDNGKITRRDGNANYRFPTGTDNVVVTYVAGRAATTETVPAKFKLAAGIMLQAMWRTQQSSAAQLGEYDVPQANFPRFAVPNAVKELLGKDWRSGSGVGD